MQAISALCQKYPRKHAVLMNFLFSMLREEVRARGLGPPGSWPPSLRLLVRTRRKHAPATVVALVTDGAPPWP